MFLYFIEAGNAIKVGVATDVESRVYSMQTGNAHEIKILHTIDMTEDKAREMEKDIHALFQTTNLRGEWFQSTQFMTEYIENIKENGFSSHLEWIKKEYENTYGKMLKEMEIQIENDIIHGNLLSIDMLKGNFNNLINNVFPEILSETPDGITQAVRDWLQKIESGSFTLKHIYRDLGIRERKEKHNVVVALLRIIESSEIIDKLGQGRYIKNNDIEDL